MAYQPSELNKGISYWRSTNWPQDFHNDFYQNIAKLREQGLFNQKWWDAFLPILRRWRATRPKSSAYLTKRAQNRFDDLNDIWNKDIIPIMGQDIEKIEWLHIAPFVRLVAEIKNVYSPVFCSKLCHFLAPNIFPVVDNAAMGNPFDSYEEYFNAGRREWHETSNDTRNILIDRFTNEIGPNMMPAFPVKCKILEL